MWKEGIEMEKDFDLETVVNEDGNIGEQTPYITPTYITYTLTLLTTATPNLSGSNYTENSDCY